MPKKYIDAEKLICDIDGSECLDTERDYEEVARRIDECEAADVEEVRHGEWEERRYDEGLVTHFYRICSCCGKEFHAALMAGCCADIDGDGYVFPYCPNCGAKMDVKESNE